jgi:hypothetical protein
LLTILNVVEHEGEAIVIRINVLFNTAVPLAEVNNAWLVFTLEILDEIIKAIRLFKQKPCDISKVRPCQDAWLDVVHARIDVALIYFEHAPEA